MRAQDPVPGEMTLLLDNLDKVSGEWLFAHTNLETELDQPFIVQLTPKGRLAFFRKNLDTVREDKDLQLENLDELVQ